MDDIQTRRAMKEKYQQPLEYLMNHLSSTLFGLGALFGAATAAFAGAGDIQTTVTPLQTNVTYSRAAPLLDTFVGLKVQLTNAGGNTINDISFTFNKDDLIRFFKENLPPI